MSQSNKQGEQEITPDKQRSQSNPSRRSNAPMKNKQNEKNDDIERSIDNEEDEVSKW